MRLLSAVVVAVSFFVFHPAQSVSAASLNEFVLTANVGDVPMLGVEVSIGMDEHSRLRAGLPIGIRQGATGLAPAMWGRALYLYNVNPRDPFSLYGGVGLTASLGGAPQPGMPNPFVEFPVGFQWRTGGAVYVLGELRMGIVPGGAGHALEVVSFVGGVSVPLG